MRLFILASLVAAALASPVGDHALEPRNNKVCSSASSIISKSKCQPTASAFCSSYLSVPAASTSTCTTTKTCTSTTTTTKTVATTTVNGPASTATTTQTVTTSTITSTDTTTIGGTVTVPAVCTAPATAVKKRGSSPRPACLSGYSSGAALSTACRCLVTSASKATTTTTVSTTILRTSTKSVTATVTGTPTTTTTVTVSTDTTTTTLSTSTNAVTVTKAPESYPASFKLYATPVAKYLRASPGSSYQYGGFFDANFAGASIVTNQHQNNELSDTSANFASVVATAATISDDSIYFVKFVDAGAVDNLRIQCDPSFDGQYCTLDCNVEGNPSFNMQQVLDDTQNRYGISSQDFGIYQIFKPIIVGL